MALTTLAVVQQIPGMNRYSAGFLQTMLASADKVIKNYCQQNLELAEYVEYRDGNNQPDLSLRQYPVLVEDLQVFFDPVGYYGQAVGAFGAGTELVLGANFALVVDGSDGTLSHRGIIRRLGGGGAAWFGFGSEMNHGGKLAASRLPIWPIGSGNVKIVYSAGYDPVPADLANACAQMAAWLARNTPMGMALQSENLGAYSYQLGAGMIGTALELGTVRSTLAFYRDMPC